MDQLTLDGRAVPHELVVLQSAPLSSAQQEILSQARREGIIATMDAGRIIHAHRHSPRPCGCPKAWLSADGWSTLNRLSRRGLVRHKKRGLWRPRALDE